MIKQLGRYGILGILGRGSMGVVYKGIDNQIGKLVAIKTMNQKILRQQEMQERFYREGAILGQLQHKNIVTVYNVGVDGDTCYIAMELLEGIPLDRLLKKKEPLSLRRVLTIIKQVCEGVHAAHKQSIIHRDLKPANIFVMDDDYVKVLDFGVAHFQNSQLTNSGMLLGTINYIAPEQITGLKVDYRADIFSIGVILYEMLSGKNPFLGKNISQTMVRIVNENPESIQTIPKPLMNVLNKALHKDRGRRYISAKLLASDIDRQLRDLSLTEEESSELRDRIAEVKRNQSEMLNKMLAQRIEAIRKHIQREELDLAEGLLFQLKRLDAKHKAIPELEAAYDKAKKRFAHKKQFEEQLVHDTLVKGNDKMADRHYVAAIEMCDKVLKVDPNNQDAKVIRANSLRKMEQFLAKHKDM